ncbi:hypothetical protein NliqN6_2258 [Naganishia liquefaciens]|uniref:Ndc10 domain-containing protein n=1 Tax=Naganishia liquefaciens TaxID=104408 RepID=A0A8H3YFM4_9TREE|nr:hypothetical protein NliqN6_2258 [Naganishia liquefaciens]
MAPGFMQRVSMVIPVAAGTEDEPLTLDNEAVLESMEVDLEKVSPAARKAAYGSGQREYREWCLQRAIKDGKVTLEQIEDPSRRALEDMKRVAVFLKGCVVGRAHKPKGKQGGKKKSDASALIEEAAGKTVGAAVLNQYLSALCRLHKNQQAAPNGQLPSPRVHPAVINLAKTERLEIAVRTKSHMNDRTENTFLDGYSTNGELAAILGEGLLRNNREGLRDRAIAALSHYGVLRGESAGGIQLADLQHLPLDEREGATLCDILVILLFNGRTNKEGKAHAMGAMRNKRWDLCPLSALGVWLFYRYAQAGDSEQSR